MTIQNYIPKEIESFVWFVDGVLVHADDMPKEFSDLFEKAKEESIRIKNEKKKALLDLLNDIDD